MPGVTYDEECGPNYFTLSACTTGDPSDMFTWEISEFRDDRRSLLQWFAWLQFNQIEMTGFNNIAYDYIIAHYLFMHPEATYQELYELSQQVILSSQDDKFSKYSVWQSDRFAPQIDLFKIHHFDNGAKSTSLKALQFAMRVPSIEEMPIPFNVRVTRDQLDQYVIPYNRHDVLETDRFAIISKPNIEFRRELRSTVQGDVLNFNDTKIGKQLIEQRLGADLCYKRVNNRKVPNQTFRDSIALADVIFPYINFQHREFNNVLEFLKQTTIVNTKGAFPEAVSATINGFTFSFGTGGIHGSVTARRVYADNDYEIVDIDVAALYPSIAIENGLYPQHLGATFVGVYRGVRDERKKYAKGTVMNGALKLSANGAYGDSNNQFSPLYDPKFTMAITINGQLLLCMLADRLLSVPTLEIIQINTDGITYRIHRSFVPTARAICQQWEAATRLVLEYENYSRMFIRDVNNYAAETPKGKRKMKGAYWYPKDYETDISNASPSAWYKDHSSYVIQRAAEAAMFLGVDPALFVPSRTDPFDFMIRAKAPRGSTVYIGDKPQQRITRYYVSKRGEPMLKRSPPVAGAIPGDWKRRNGLSDGEYYAVLNTISPGEWDARIHTANKSKYDDREMSLQSGWLVTECNRADTFDRSNVNYQFYIDETRKLIII
jgi:hypothetical protein